MEGERQLFNEIYLTRDLRVGTQRLLATEVDINEIIPGSPVISLELFKSDSNFLTSGLLIGIEVTTEIVMQLNVLCIDCEGNFSPGSSTSFSW